MKDIKQIFDELEIFNEDEKYAMDLEAELICNIINQRKALGITQRKLAEISGIQQSTIARLESGMTLPRIDTIFKLLKYLGLKIKIEKE